MFDKAIKILESMNGTQPDADYKLGILYLRGVHTNPPKSDVFRAQYHLQNAARFNHLDAIHALGMLNFRGSYGYKQNLTQARKYLEDAARKGHRGAQYDFACMCKYGTGGEKDVVTALENFEKAAQKGHVSAMMELAVLYQEKECRNYQKAFEWAKTSAELGNSEGEFVLANLYYFGRGCMPDNNKAQYYYRQAYDHGVLEAKFMLNKLNSKD